MKRWIGPLAVLIITAAAAHLATLSYAPSVIMDRALSTLKDRGVALHAFTTPQRITPQTQVVVRSSPDLFYSLCRFDFSKIEGPISITVGYWPDYQSLSFFDAETNNFATRRLSGRGDEVQLFRPGALGEGTQFGEHSPSERGVILIRRLAPTAELFAAAELAAKHDKCEPLTAFYSQSEM